MANAPEVIEVTSGEVAAQLKRRGISSDERVTLTIEPEREPIPGRRESRDRVVAAGLRDEDIDQLIKDAQQSQPPSIHGTTFPAVMRHLTTPLEPPLPQEHV